MKVWWTCRSSDGTKSSTGSGYSRDSVAPLELACCAEDIVDHAPLGGTGTLPTTQCVRSASKAAGTAVATITEIISNGSMW